MSAWKEAQEAMDETVDAELTDARESLKRASGAKTKAAFIEAVEAARSALEVALEELNDLDWDG